MVVSFSVHCPTFFVIIHYLHVVVMVGGFKPLPYPTIKTSVQELEIVNQTKMFESWQETMPFCLYTCSNFPVLECALYLHARA